ncbi:hypothetical protein R1sor_015629 [Riccia sorocarpa]|uniref:DDE Tnp4 domain-containing protein n=1 Tax=Riccia sorocarpa TaxID=122646 RepID=A0ABD3HG46_9MARC
MRGNCNDVTCLRRSALWRRLNSTQLFDDGQYLLGDSDYVPLERLVCSYKRSGGDMDKSFNTCIAHARTEFVKVFVLNWDDNIRSSSVDGHTIPMNVDVIKQVFGLAEGRTAPRSAKHYKDLSDWVPERSKTTKTWIVGDEQLVHRDSDEIASSHSQSRSPDRNSASSSAYPRIPGPRASTNDSECSTSKQLSGSSDREGEEEATPIVQTSSRSPDRHVASPLSSPADPRARTPDCGVASPSSRPADPRARIPDRGVALLSSSHVDPRAKTPDRGVASPSPALQGFLQIQEPYLWHRISHPLHHQTARHQVRTALFQVHTISSESWSRLPSIAGRYLPRHR